MFCCFENIISCIWDSLTKQKEIIYETYYKNGTISSKYIHVKYQKLVEYIEYYENGNIKLSGFCYNDNYKKVYGYAKDGTARKVLLSDPNVPTPPFFGDKLNGKSGGKFIKYYKFKNNRKKNIVIYDKKGLLGNSIERANYMIYGPKPLRFEKYYKNGYINNKKYKNKKIFFY